MKALGQEGVGGHGQTNEQMRSQSSRECLDHPCEAHTPISLLHHPQPAVPPHLLTLHASPSHRMLRGAARLSGPPLQLS